MTTRDFPVSASSARRRDLIAIMVTEAREAARGNATAIATILQANQELGRLVDVDLSDACPRLTRDNTGLMVRYHAGRDALSPKPAEPDDLVARMSAALDRAYDGSPIPSPAVFSERGVL